METEAPIKLFGRCKRVGQCICGHCLDAPVNRQDEVRVTSPDGAVSYMRMPAMPDALKASLVAHETAPKPKISGRDRQYERCVVCNRRLFKGRNHRCLGAVPVEASHQQITPHLDLDQFRTEPINSPQPELPISEPQVIEAPGHEVVIKLNGMVITIRPLKEGE